MALISTAEFQATTRGDGEHASAYWTNPDAVALVAAYKAQTPAQTLEADNPGITTTVYATPQEDPLYSQMNGLIASPGGYDKYYQLDAVINSLESKYPGQGIAERAWGSARQNSVSAADIARQADIDRGGIGTAYTSQKAASGDATAAAMVSSGAWQPGTPKAEEAAAKIGISPVVSSNPAINSNPVVNTSEVYNIGDMSPKSGMVWSGTGWTGVQNVPGAQVAMVRAGFDPLASSLGESYYNVMTNSINEKAGRYYGNELQKSVQNYVELSSAYHNWGQKTGLPVAANPYEYAGDLALGILKGTNQSSKSSVYGENITDYSTLNLPGGLGIQDVPWNSAIEYDRKSGWKADYSGYDTAIAKLQNAVANKEMGVYGNIPAPTSTQQGGETRKLSLGEQQAIGIAASGSVLTPADLRNPYVSTGTLLGFGAAGNTQIAQEAAENLYASPKTQGFGSSYIDTVAPSVRSAVASPLEELGASGMYMVPGTLAKVETPTSVELTKSYSYDLPILGTVATGETALGIHNFLNSDNPIISTFTMGSGLSDLKDFERTDSIMNIIGQPVKETVTLNGPTKTTPSYVYNLPIIGSVSGEGANWIHDSVLSGPLSGYENTSYTITPSSKSAGADYTGRFLNEYTGAVEPVGTSKEFLVYPVTQDIKVGKSNYESAWDRVANIEQYYAPKIPQAWSESAESLSQNTDALKYIPVMGMALSNAAKVPAVASGMYTGVRTNPRETAENLVMGAVLFGIFGAASSVSKYAIGSTAEGTAARKVTSTLGSVFNVGTKYVLPGLYAADVGIRSEGSYTKLGGILGTETIPMMVGGGIVSGDVGSLYNSAKSSARNAYEDISIKIFYARHGITRLEPGAGWKNMYSETGGSSPNVPKIGGGGGFLLEPGAKPASPKPSGGGNTASKSISVAFDVAEPMIKTPGVDYISENMKIHYGTTSPKFVENLVKQNAVAKAQEKFISGENLPTVGKGMTTTSFGLPDVAPGSIRFVHATGVTDVAPFETKGLAYRGDISSTTQRLGSSSEWRTNLESYLKGSGREFYGDNLVFIDLTESQFSSFGSPKFKQSGVGIKTPEELALMQPGARKLYELKMKQDTARRNSATESNIPDRILNPDFTGDSGIYSGTSQGKYITGKNTFVGMTTRDNLLSMFTSGGNLPTIGGNKEPISFLASDTAILSSRRNLGRLLREPHEFAFALDAVTGDIVGVSPGKVGYTTPEAYVDVLGQAKSAGSTDIVLGHGHNKLGSTAGVVLEHPSDIDVMGAPLWKTYAKENFGLNIKASAVLSEEGISLYDVPNVEVGKSYSSFVNRNMNLPQELLGTAGKEYYRYEKAARGKALAELPGMTSQFISFPTPEYRFPVFDVKIGGVGNTALSGGSRLPNYPQIVYGNVEKDISPTGVGGFQTLGYTKGKLPALDTLHYGTLEAIVGSGGHTRFTKSGHQMAGEIVNLKPGESEMFDFISPTGERIVGKRVGVAELDKAGRRGGYVSHAYIVPKGADISGLKFVSSTEEALGLAKKLNVGETPPGAQILRGGKEEAIGKGSNIDYNRGGEVGKFLDTTPSGWFKPAGKTASLNAQIATLQRLPVSDAARYADLEMMFDQPTPLLEATTSKALIVPSDMLLSGRTLTDTTVGPAGTRISQVSPSGRVGVLGFDVGANVKTFEGYTTGTRSQQKIERSENIFINPYSGETTVIGKRFVTYNPPKPGAPEFEFYRGKMNIYNLPVFEATTGVGIPKISDVSSASFRKGMDVFGAVKEKGSGGKVYQNAYLYDIANEEFVGTKILKQTSEASRAIEDILGSNAPEKLGVSSYAISKSPSVGKVSTASAFRPTNPIGRSAQELAGTYIPPVRTVKSGATVEPVTSGEQRMAPLQFKDVAPEEMRSTLIQSMFSEFAPRTQKKAVSAAGRAKYLASSKKQVEQENKIKFAEADQRMNRLTYEIPSEPLIDTTQSRRISNAMFKVARKQAPLIALLSTEIAHESLSAKKATAVSGKAKYYETSVLSIPETRTLDTLFERDVNSLDDVARRPESEIRPISGTDLKSATIPVSTTISKTAQITRPDQITRPAQITIPGRIVYPETSLPPETRTTTKPKPTETKLPGIPLLPSFQPGGGTGSSGTGRGKRYRETFSYNFAWQKSTNVGAAKPQKAKPSTSKPSIGMSLPKMGEGLLSPKKSVVQISNPSRALKSSIPKSLMSPPSQPIGKSSTVIAKKKKGKK